MDEDIDDVSSGIICAIEESNINSYAANSGIEFRGRSLDEWANILIFPELSSSNNISLHELEKYNIVYLKLVETIMSNYGYASNSYNMSNLKYLIELDKQKSALMSSINNSNKRLPSKDVLHEMAKSLCMSTYTSKKM